MTNLFFDYSSILVLVAIMGALFTRKLTKGRTNMLYLLLVVVVMLTAILDIVTEAFGPYYEATAFNLYPQIALNFLYFLFRNLTFPMYILYVCSTLGIWHKISGNMRIHLAWAVPFLIDCILLIVNFFNGCIFYFDENYIYHRGPFIGLVYAIGFYYVFFCYFILLKNRSLVSVRTMVILLMFIPLNLLAVVVQMFMPDMRAEIFASTMLALVLAVEVHRPEETMDMEIGSRNYPSFLERVRKSTITEYPIAVLLIKFTNSSEIRDNLGIELYHTLLRRISNKLEQISKIMGIYQEVYYLDQGAFAVVGRANKYDNMLDMGRIIMAYMQEPITLGQMEVVLDPLIAIVKYPEDISSMDTFINFSNTFYKKLDKSSRVVNVSELANTKDFKVMTHMDTIINRGISEHHFEMYYQPIYSIKEHKFASAEALIRLFDDEYGMISPAIFIPVAEESGAIHQIGDYVLEDVCRFISMSNFRRLGLEYIELNLSVAQCIETNLADKVLRIMKENGVTADQINLEITETGVDYDPETTDRNITALSEAGLTFSLDDYGTGYSNISRVASLPLNIVKLDKSLVDEMDSGIMWTVIKNTVEMLQEMNKKILVEGVETKEAADKFIELGCDYIQGYYYSKPLPEAEFIKFVKTHNNAV